MGVLRREQDLHGIHLWVTVQRQRESGLDEIGHHIRSRSVIRKIAKSPADM
jgi:hypothetical protein